MSGLDAERYKLIDRIATRSCARTSLWVPETRRLYLALPMRDGQSAEVRAYEMQEERIVQADVVAWKQ